MKDIVHSNKAFTLVEILVVMAIISILAIFILGGFRSSQRRARDAARKSNLKQIANALEMFYSDYEHYPAPKDGAIRACPYDDIDLNGSVKCMWGVFGADEFTDTKTIYFKSLPKDPSEGATFYYRTLYNNAAYQLYAHLENPEDPNCINSDCSDITGLPNGVDCGVAPIDCNFAVTSSNVTAKETGD